MTDLLQLTFSGLAQGAVYGLIALWPSQEYWDAGDRAVACAVFAPDGSAFETRQL